MAEEYVYPDEFRQDVYRMIPDDDRVIGVIGCGSAKTEWKLIEQGREVHGVDVSDHAIDIAKTRLTSARVISPDDVSPFPENHLDGLILPDVLEHIPNAFEALQSFVKMVKPGGWVVISVPNMRYVEALWQFVVKGDWPEYPMGIFDYTHLQVMTHKRLYRWAKSSELKVDQEFDNYDFRFIRRNIYRVINLMSFRLLKSFTNFEIQIRFRKIS